MESAEAVNPQTFNRYSYVLNNPLNLTDSSGMALDSSKSDPVNYSFGLRQEGVYGNLEFGSWSIESKDSNAEPQQANFDASHSNGNPEDEKIDSELTKLFTNPAQGGFVRGASSMRIGGPTGDNHYELGDGQLHTIHIYGDESANKVVGVYIPARFSQITYAGTRMSSVVAVDPRTGEVIRASHIQVSSQAELERNLRMPRNSAGSRFIGNNGGPQGNGPGNIHAHITIFRSRAAMNSAMTYKYRNGAMGEYDSHVKTYLGDFRRLVMR